MLALFALSVLAAGPFEADDWAQRPLSEAALDSLMPEEFRLRRNEVFARHGFVFKSEPSHLVSVEVSVAEGAVPAVTVTTTVDDESAKGVKRSRASSRTLKWKARAFR